MPSPTTDHIYTFISACSAPSRQPFWMHLWVVIQIMLMHQYGRIDAYRIGRFNQTSVNRSGGFPKFAQSISSANKFINEIYKFSNNNNPESRYRPQSNRHSCGIRTINYSPKRSSRIIGGTHFPLTIGVLNLLLQSIDDISNVLLI